MRNEPEWKCERHFDADGVEYDVRVERFDDSSGYIGSWTCARCRERGGPSIMSLELEVAVDRTKHSFTTHYELCHRGRQS